MQCFNPRVGFHRFDGTKIAYTHLSWQTFIVRQNDLYAIPELKNSLSTQAKNIDVTRPIKLPCSKCDSCRMNQARDLATRCMMDFHTANQIGIFLTLTYDEKHIPKNGKYNLQHPVLFMKSLRKIAKVRSLGVAEYGERTKRPHFHLLLFGWEPPTRELVRTSDSTHSGQNYDIFTSKTLDKLWTHGKHEFGNITQQSCSYVARYTHDKNKKASENFPAKAVCRSRRPGLGATFTDLYASSIVNASAVLLRDSSGDVLKLPLPRYVFNRLCSRNPSHHQLLLTQREAYEKTRNFYEETKNRIDPKKIIFLQKINKLKRNSI